MECGASSLKARAMAVTATQSEPRSAFTQRLSGIWRPERLYKEEESSYSIGLWGKDLIHKVVDSPSKKGPLVP